MSLYFYLIILTLCFLVGLFYLRDLPESLIPIFFLVLTTVIVESIGLYFLKVLHRTASIIFHIYQIFEYFFLAKFFLHIVRSVQWKRIINASIYCIIFINLLTIFHMVDNTRLFNVYVFLSAALLLTVWSFLYFSQLFQNIQEFRLEKNPNFWICTGIVFFYAGSFFQMGFTNSIYRYSPELARQLYVINHLLNCIFYGLVTYGFICQTKYRNQL
ncbi:hypothetical protein SAMN04487995_0917 [Dyadobacter koreensis]|uniref:Uncharacterized protein n=1 Tax=Dyadobacter koreensis TaxID=408657 RepID=A0A1H6R4E9_9BACT|nr:hypothetical protein SAMN04487995_0917 [Dyadobacter koreensis]